jgi:hypothetical protein
MAVDSRSAQAAAPLAELQATVQRLRATIQQLELERARRGRAQRRRVLAAGVGLSLLLHAGLLTYLSTVHRAGPAGPAVQTVSIDFATLSEEQLSDADQLLPDELEATDVPSISDVPEAVTLARLDVAAPSVTLTLSRGESTPGLGGAGSAAGDGSSGPTLGGGGGTSFFGLSSRGSRFAYIVDISASMQQGDRLGRAMDEIERSIGQLPDYSYFYIVLFSSDLVMPPMQQGWLRARRGTVQAISRWLRTIGAAGTTEPLPAFHQVFSLTERPDAIFFLTDGEIPSMTGGDVRSMNDRGRRVLIHTIAFGNDAGQDLLRELARDSGGKYRFVPAGERGVP